MNATATNQIEQNHTNGQRVFTFAISLFGSSRKVLGKVKECKKHKWVIFDDGTRVRYDRGTWYTEEQLAQRNQRLQEEAKHEAKSKAKYEAELKAKYEEKISSLVKVEPKVGKQVKIIAQRCDMEFIYTIVDINKFGVFAIDEDGREVSIGSINSDYYEV